MKIALDTNRYTDAARGHPDVVRVLNAAREIWMPFIVLGELRAGFACGNAGDIWIAALTLQYDLILATRDEHFQKLPQIARI
jgi:predicted nucleic acid-binding protein